MGITVILLALGLLIFFAYRGVSVLFLAPMLAVLVAWASGAPTLASYTQLFMTKTAEFIASYFPLFFLGAIFGKLMQVSGSASCIGHWCVRWLGEQRAMLAVILACGVLTYGGVSLFVVAFAVYPICAAVFRRADIPARLIPGTIALGSFTFTMTALPGTPAIQNAIPMPYFGTTAFAGPGLGLVAAAIMLVVGYAWLAHRYRLARSKGEGFERNPKATRDEVVEEFRDRAQGEGFDLAEIGTRASSGGGIARSLLPVVVVIALNFALSRYYFPGADLTYLASPLWGGLLPKDVIGLWSIIVSLTVACLLIIALNFKTLRNSVATALADGADAAVIPIFNTASLVGFGAVIAAQPAFTALSSSLLDFYVRIFV